MAAKSGGIDFMFLGPPYPATGSATEILVSCSPLGSWIPPPPRSREFLDAQLISAKNSKFLVRNNKIILLIFKVLNEKLFGVYRPQASGVPQRDSQVPGPVQKNRGSPLNM